MSIERRIVLALIKIPITACVMLIKVSKRNSVLLKIGTNCIFDTCKPPVEGLKIHQRVRLYKAEHAPTKSLNHWRPGLSQQC
jgi:hypothetical protein